MSAARSARFSASLPSVKVTGPHRCVVEAARGHGIDGRGHPEGARPAQARHVAPCHAAARRRHRRDSFGVFEAHPPVRRSGSSFATSMRAAATTARSPSCSGPATPTIPTAEYGIPDYRGGGRQSARETAVRVAAGAIAKKWLHERHAIVVRGYLAALVRTWCRSRIGMRCIAIRFFVATRVSCPSWKRSWIGCANRAIRAARV